MRALAQSEKRATAVSRYPRPCGRSERWMGRAPGTVVPPPVSPGSPSAGPPAETRCRPRHDRGETAGSPAEVWFESTGLFRSRP